MVRAVVFSADCNDKFIDQKWERAKNYMREFYSDERNTAAENRKNLRTFEFTFSGLGKLLKSSKNSHGVVIYYQDGNLYLDVKNDEGGKETFEICWFKENAAKCGQDGLLSLAYLG